VGHWVRPLPQVVWQVPALHIVPGAHCFPQPPQFMLSVLVFAQVLPHWVNPLPQVV